MSSMALKKSSQNSKSERCSQAKWTAKAVTSASMQEPVEQKLAIGRSCYPGCTKDGQAKEAGTSRCLTQSKAMWRGLKASHLKLRGLLRMAIAKQRRESIG